MGSFHYCCFPSLHGFLTESFCWAARVARLAGCFDHFHLQSDWSKVCRTTNFWHQQILCRLSHCGQIVVGFGGLGVLKAESTPIQGRTKVTTKHKVVDWKLKQCYTIIPCFKHVCHTIWMFKLVCCIQWSLEELSSPQVIRELELESSWIHIGRDSKLHMIS